MNETQPQENQHGRTIDIEANRHQWVMDWAKDAWVSKMDKTRMHRYQMAKQIYGL
jgi:hypothetical protein